MSRWIKGVAYQHDKTKQLLLTIPKRAIAIVRHADIDSLAVEGLLNRKVKAVINFEPSMSGLYRHDHVQKLLDANIPVFDVKKSHLKNIADLNGSRVEIEQDSSLFLVSNQTRSYVASLIPYNEQTVTKINVCADHQFPQTFEAFFQNTIAYAQKELSFFTKKPIIPKMFQHLAEKDIVIVARSVGYEEDIRALRSWLKRKSLIKIAVDGAADGLMRQRIKPDLIVGDMDSVSEKTLQQVSNRLVHQYLNGYAPGAERLQGLGLEGECFSFVGTSEDVAIHLAYWAGARHLYLIGCRSGFNEFLEKGRAGMGSSFLCRMQAGARVTDVKGIHRMVGTNETLPIWSFSIPLLVSLGMIVSHPRVELVAHLMWNWLKGGVVR
ncbi:putative cytokinetic ring protein SteA [Halalkalibacterium ligniniphilum]|uniref:putative cytokinetic ring protein SteA n=1 Tax=Halalkalibacterium ligniniphilum TaxID=1134413 RepID=UPI000345CD94|nr:putative cytokinetic ring protein SteA [Halalkalibacterium ligniniphilum]